MSDADNPCLTLSASAMGPPVGNDLHSGAEAGEYARAH
jgi:hypothetical protein